MEDNTAQILRNIKSVIVDGEYQAIIVPPVKDKWEDD